MLTLEALQRQLNRISYKPGFAFRLWQHDWEGIWLTITAELPDAHRPGTTTTVRINTAVPPCPTGGYFFDWLAYRLSRVEIHELREFLQVDGLAIFDPHAPDANDMSALRR
jgi:hypothetical protein